MYTKQLNIVNVGDTDEVVWGFQGFNRACSAYLQILKDRSELHYIGKQMCHEAYQEASHMQFL